MIHPEQTMRIITAEIESYFSLLNSRIGTAMPVPFRAVSIGSWEPQTSRCHENADYWVAHNATFDVVRGWLINGPDSAGQCMFIAHSLVEEEGLLYDITPLPPPILHFLRHEGPQDQFDVLKITWTGVSYPFITASSFDPRDSNKEYEQE